MYAELHIMPNGGLFYAKAERLGASDDEIMALRSSALTPERAQQIVAALNLQFAYLVGVLPEGSA